MIDLDLPPPCPECGGVLTLTDLSDEEGPWFGIDCPACGWLMQDLNERPTCRTLPWSAPFAAEIARLRATLDRLYATAGAALEDYPDTETLRQQVAHHALVGVIYSMETP